MKLKYIPRHLKLPWATSYSFKDALLKRSFIANPIPSFGIGLTEIVMGSELSKRCRKLKRF